LEPDTIPVKPSVKASFAKGLLKIIALIPIFIILISMWVWATAAIYFSNLPGVYLRIGVAVIFALGTLCAFIFIPKLRRKIFCFLGLFAIVLIWWILIPASNNRDWVTEVAVAPYATIDGDLVTIHNIRNFDYTTRDDFTVHYYDKTFDLNKLATVDFVASYWDFEAIAHTFLAFGFDDGEHVAISIEIREEKGESYSTIKGIFKQFELIYVVGDERDLIRLRTNYRKEDVFLYQTNTPRENVRLLFMDYIKRIKKMVEYPEFYNTITNNCTINILKHSNSFPPYHSYNREILFSGYTDKYIYDVGRLATTLPFDELKKRCRINESAQAANDDPDYSTIIRAHFDDLGDK